MRTILKTLVIVSATLCGFCLLTFPLAINGMTGETVDGYWSVVTVLAVATVVFVILWLIVRKRSPLSQAREREGPASRSDVGG